jgi:hypothetical protein
MATGANNSPRSGSKGPIEAFHHAVPATELVAAAPLLLWVACDGLQLTWCISPESRSEILEVGRCEVEDLGLWLSEKLTSRREISGVHWGDWADYGLVPTGVRQPADDRALLELELGEVVARTRAGEVVGTPYTVVHAVDESRQAALTKVLPSIEFHNPTRLLAESFCRDERSRKDTALLVVVRKRAEKVDFCALSAGVLHAVVSHSVADAQDVLYRAVHLCESLAWSRSTRILLSGDVEVVGDHIKGFKAQFDKADLYFGRFIPTRGAVSAVHRQQILGLIQMIECA